MRRQKEKKRRKRQPFAVMIPNITRLLYMKFAEMQLGRNYTRNKRTSNFINIFKIVKKFRS